MKTRKLVELHRANGSYVARWYDSETGAFGTWRFFGYTKREVIRKLRTELGCIVPREFC